MRSPAVVWKLYMKAELVKWAELVIDDPAETGCHGFVLRLGKVRLSVTWPAKTACPFCRGLGDCIECDPETAWK